MLPSPVPASSPSRRKRPASSSRRPSSRVSSRRHTAFVDRRRCLISLPSRPLPIFSLRPPAKREEECSVGLISHLISLRRTRPTQPLFIVHTPLPANQLFRPHFRGLGYSWSLSSTNCRCSFSTGPSLSCKLPHSTRHRRTYLDTRTLLRPRPKLVEASAAQPAHPIRLCLVRPRNCARRQRRK